MSLEITNWNNNNNIISELTTDDIFLTKSNLNESIIDDSNYVSEDSVTLTEGSVEKDEDSLDYQNEYGNNDSITNSISDEFRDFNEKSINKSLHSNNNNVKPLNNDDKEEELKCVNLIEEMVLHNIDMLESDNREITLFQTNNNTTEKESDKMDNENDNSNSEDLNNFYDCEEEISESLENISDNFGKINNSENILNKSYDILPGKLIDIDKTKPDSLELSSEENSSMTNNNNCNNANYSDKSELKSSEILFDESCCLDYNNQDFVSSNWLMSGVNDDNHDDDFDIENVFSFKKMKLSHFKINNEPFSLELFSRNKYSQNNNNSYLNVYSSLLPTNETPIDFTNIYSSSTPCATKHKNRNKNETFSKSPIETSKSESIDNVSMEFKNKTFNLEENHKEKKSIDSNLFTPCSQINNDVPDETVDLISVELNKFAATSSKLQKPIENGSVVPEKSNRFNKKNTIGSLVSFPSKSNPQSSDKPIDETKNKSLLKLPMDPPKAPILSIKPPSNDSSLKKFFSKSLFRDSTASISSLNDVVKTRSVLPEFDPNRRHTITEEGLNSQRAAVPKPSSRPTSLIKSNELKHPIGNCKIAKPIRPSSSMTSSNKAQKSVPSHSVSLVPPVPLLPSSQKEMVGIPNTVKTIKKLQKIAKLSSKNNNKNNNQQESSQPKATVTIVTPIISENPPIISPTTNTNYSINNPLNRTFDREDFQILKSFTLDNGNGNNNNGSCSESSSLSSDDVTIRSSSTASSENNNNNNNKSPQQISGRSPAEEHLEQQKLGIYQLAQKEEEDLKKHVNNSALIRQTVGGFRSLKLPSQIKPRRMMMIVPPPLPATTTGTLLKK